MKKEEIREIMVAMREEGIVSLHLKQRGVDLEMHTAEAVPAQENVPIGHAPHAPIVSPPRDSGVKGGSTAPEQSLGKSISSPMVGTFYASPSPEASPFVSVGDRVKEGTVVCIIEAMKVMNEIRATEGGIVKQICFEDGQIVEFGSDLFVLEPSS